MPVKHTAPEFVTKVISAAAYEAWLQRKAESHANRDRKRGHTTAAISLYKSGIHQAVIASGGVDAYTGETLDWTLINLYNNDESKTGGHAYKSQFALMPTVDHVEANSLIASFRICAWRTNDAKHDLPVDAFLSLCKAALVHAGYSVVDPKPKAR